MHFQVRYSKCSEHVRYLYRFVQYLIVDPRYGEDRVEREGRQPAAGGRTDYLKTATPGNSDYQTTCFGAVKPIILIS